MYCLRVHHIKENECYMHATFFYMCKRKEKYFHWRVRMEMILFLYVHDIFYKINLGISELLFTGLDYDSKKISFL